MLRSKSKEEIPSHPIHWVISAKENWHTTQNFLLMGPKIATVVLCMLTSFLVYLYCLSIPPVYARFAYIFFFLFAILLLDWFQKGFNYISINIKFLKKIFFLPLKALLIKSDVVKSGFIVIS